MLADPENSTLTVSVIATTSGDTNGRVTESGNVSLISAPDEDYCAFSIVAAWMHIAFGVIGFAVNALVVQLVLYHKALRTKASILLLNMLVADGFYGLAYAARGIIFLQEDCPDVAKPLWMCLYTNVVLWIAVQLSLFTALSVTVGRLLGIIFILKHRYLKDDFALVLVPLPWLLAIVSLILAFARRWSMGDNSSTSVFCHSSEVLTPWFYVIYHHSKTLSMILIFVLYLMIAVWLYYKRKRCGSVSIASNQLQASKLVLMIVGMYLVLWMLPLTAFLSVSSVMGQRNPWSVELTEKYVMLLPVASTTFNAIVFVLRFDDLKVWLLQQHKLFVSQLSVHTPTSTTPIWPASRQTRSVST